MPMFPAQEDEDGAPKKEFYFMDDKQHREDGPAVIEYGQSGDVLKELWFDRGVQFIPSLKQVELYRNKSSSTSAIDSGIGT